MGAQLVSFFIPYFLSNTTMASSKSLNMIVRVSITRGVSFNIYEQLVVVPTVPLR